MNPQTPNLEATDHDYDVLFICPPYLTEEPPLAFFRDASFKFEIINPGVLSLASHLTSQGFSSRILDISVDNDFSRIGEELQRGTPRVIGVSNNTGFDYVESLRCLELAKEHSPTSLTVMGGEHCSSLGSLVFEETDHLDALVLGEGELSLEQMLIRGRENFEDIRGVMFKRDDGSIHLPLGLSERPRELPKIDYSLYPNVSYFTPYVEESRGCPKKCKFCPNEEFYSAIVRFKPFEVLSEELDQVAEIWGPGKTLALLTSNFGVAKKKAMEQIRILKEKNMEWGTQTSSDSAWETWLSPAYDAGLRILTVGFESGSVEILERIHKTNDIPRYLERSEGLLNAAAEFPDLVTKFNFIFYIGETPSTLKETLNFMVRNDRLIDTLIYTPLFVTPGTELAHNFGEYAQRFGAKILPDEYWARRHLTPCDLSRDHKYEEVVAYCRMMESIFSDQGSTVRAESQHYSQEKREAAMKAQNTKDELARENLFR